MSFEWNKHALLYVALCLCCVTVGLYGYLYMRVTDLHEGITVLQEERAVLQANLNAARIAEATLVEADRHYNELLKHVVEQENPTAFLAHLEEINVVPGVTVDVANLTDQARGDSGSRELSVVLDVFGTWEGVTNALQMIEILPYISAIDRVALNQTTIEGGVGWRASVTIRLLLQ